MSRCLIKVFICGGNCCDFIYSANYILIIFLKNEASFTVLVSFGIIYFVPAKRVEDWKLVAILDVLCTEVEVNLI